MDREKLDSVALSLERLLASGGGAGFESSIECAITLIRSYGRLEDQFNAMADIAERAMAVAKLSNQ